MFADKHIAAINRQPSSRKPAQFTLLNLATVGFAVAWLAVACYALAYLISHGPG